jgi:small subunit ribosomal protein SAe
MRGTITRDSWDVPVDLFFYRDPEELEKNEETMMVRDTEETVAPVVVPTEYEVNTQNWDSGGDGGWDAAAPVTNM